MADCKKCTKKKPDFSKDLSDARYSKIIRRLVAAIVVIVIAFVLALLANNIAWMIHWNQYEYVAEDISYSYNQDGHGVNVIGDSNEVNNGTESLDP